MSDVNSETPKKKKLRDYLKLINTILREAAEADLEVRILASLSYDDGYPFLMLKSETKEAKYNVVITAGFHGDEPWALDCLIHALDDLDTDLFNFWIFPVANPWGYAHVSRLNGERKGSNWKVGQRPTLELDLVFKNIPSKVDLFIDVHGDKDRSEVYAYERRLPKSPSLAKLALRDAENYFDIYGAQTVYKEPCEDGVVTSGKEDTIEEYLFEVRGAPYSITLEIPGKVQGTGTNRTAGGARLIVAILNNFERVKHHKTRK